MKVEDFRNRLHMDTALRDGITEERNGQNPFLWKGSVTGFECGLFRGDDFVNDISNFASMTFEVKPADNITGSPIISKTLLGSDLNGALTLDQWEDGMPEHCHARFVFTSDQTNSFDLGGNTSKNFWLVIAAKRTDGQAITLGACELTVQEDGSSVTPSALGTGNTRFNLGNIELLYTDASWHAWTMGRIADGLYVLDINQVGSGATADLVSVKWRYNAGLPQLQAVDNSWHGLVPRIDAEGIYVLDIDQSAGGSADGDASKFRLNLGFPEIQWPDNTWHRLKPVLNAEAQYVFDIEQTATP